MKTAIPLLADVRVASPCHAAWSSMVGDEQTRYCSLCRKNVYNLSEMTRQEAEALIREKEGKLCVRYYQRTDGTVLTKDCPIGKAVVQRMLLARAVSASAALVTVIALFGRDIRAALLPDNTPRIVAGGMGPALSEETIGKVVAEPPKPEPLMGDVAVIRNPKLETRMGEVARWTPSEEIEPSKPQTVQGALITPLEEQRAIWFPESAPKPKLKKE